MTGNTEIVRILLEQGAKPDMQETDGTNAIVVTAGDDLAQTLKTSFMRNQD